MKKKKFKNKNKNKKKKARQERRLPLALEWATPPISLPLASDFN